MTEARRVEPAASVRGALAVPGAKSIAHRALLLGALADGPSEIRGFGASGDTLSTVSVLGQLGVETERSADVVRVHGVGLRGLRVPDGPLDCGNAGTLMRLLAGILAGHGGAFTLTGDESLSRRPMERIAVPLRQMGARVETVDGRAPLTIEGGALQPLRYELPVASAQVKSCVLLAGLYAQAGPTTVVERVTTRDHTERMLQAAGVRVRTRPHEATVWPADRLEPLSLEVSGDFSSAAPYLVAATLLPGSELVLAGVNVNPTRTGLVGVLERMGARIAVFNRRSVSGEPVADISVAHSELTATEVTGEEVPDLVDELPLFALAAACARGRSIVRGAAELRTKESDRVETVADALRALGGHIEATPDGWRIRGVPARLRGGRMQSAGDHRIAMLGAVAGLYSREGVEIEDADAASVSFPEFYDLLESVAARHSPA